MSTITQSHTFREMTGDMRPQDPSLDGAGWKFETLEMPQAIKATDRQGRACIYVPVRVQGHVVDSLGFSQETKP